eukprot:CAMPEP_0195295828 /NCGR_PEP_ID=MMETSP0707-20130614/18146_1 /TAXON_ID=33640 /ORGANISM="Asterionellopsis glacialis, Strain CCMP134" /LENGTH=381 /DNA_ID=CAMNT_0040357153 /DNA_START=49 /DNA_END=1194 /DNA_ORIENTATION=+
MAASPRLKKISRALLASIALVALNDFFSFSQIEEKADSSPSFVRGLSRQLHTDSSSNGASSKPMIYTFVDTSDDIESTTDLVEKMSDELVEEWKKAWSDAGWNPVILTKEDAEKHKLYNEFNEKLQRIIMKQQQQQKEEIKHKLLVAEIRGISSSSASTMKMCGEQHNSFCFLRYLAMASVGGGYMSDYNIFPLPKAKYKAYDAPKEGTFTTYGLNAADGDDIPCLAYGNANEWTRIANNLMEVITKEEDSDESNSSDDVKTMSIDSRGWRDTAALLVLNATHPNIFNSNNDDVLNRAGFLKLNEEAELLASKDCSRAGSKWAVYFSYSDVTAAGHRSDLQSSLAFKLLKDWNAMCFAPSEGEPEHEEKGETEKIGKPIES